MSFCTKAISVSALSIACAYLAISSDANASMITKTFDYTFQNLISFSDPGDPAPIDPVTISGTVTFDPTVDVEHQTTGVTITSSSIPVSLPISFYYTVGSGENPSVLSIGVLQNGVDPSLVLGQNAFLLQIGNPQAATPAFVGLLYGLAGTSTQWTGNGVSDATPEPATWSLMMLGIGFVGTRLRTARRQASALA